MKSKKSYKGQTSLEYVMTYGWMIIVVMIVGIVLWQMGAFDPPKPSRECRGFSQMTVLDWKASAATDNLELVLQNEAGTKLELDNVRATIDSNPPCTPLLGLAAEIRPGRTDKRTLANCGIAGYKLGASYQADITIEYFNVGSTIAHKSVGKCWGMIE